MVTCIRRFDDLQRRLLKGLQLAVFDERVDGFDAGHELEVEIPDRVVETKSRVSFGLGKE
jgi:hypothetical protein